jgi:FAD/FMN-containing dehydrogenase
MNTKYKIEADVNNARRRRAGEAGLERHVEGEVLFDRFTAGATPPTPRIYQIEPLGVVVPRRSDVEAAIAIAREEGVPVLPRGGGTSQCGQTVNRGAGRRLLQAPQPHPRVDVRGARCASSPASCSTTLNRR